MPFGQFKFGTGNNCTGGFTELKAAAAVSPTGQATYTTSSLPTGSTVIFACYIGTGGGSGTQDSSGSVSQTVNGAAVNRDGATDIALDAHFDRRERRRQRRRRDPEHDRPRRRQHVHLHPRRGHRLDRQRLVQHQRQPPAGTSSLQLRGHSSSYSVRVRSTDQGGLFFEEPFTITVTNVNETPTDIALSPASIAENAGPNADGRDPQHDRPRRRQHVHLHPRRGHRLDRQRLVQHRRQPACGRTRPQLRGAESPTRSASASTDQGGLFFEEVFTITVTNVNETPTDIALVERHRSPRTPAPNAAVGTLSTTDPDAGNTFTYTLVAGTGSTDNASFNIIGNPLRATRSLDFEAQSSYSVRVRVHRPGRPVLRGAFTITVTNVNEAPTVTLAGALGVCEGSNESVFVQRRRSRRRRHVHARRTECGTGGSQVGAGHVQHRDGCGQLRLLVPRRPGQPDRQRDGQRLATARPTATRSTVTVNNVAPTVTLTGLDARPTRARRTPTASRSAIRVRTRSRSATDCGASGSQVGVGHVQRRHGCRQLRLHLPRRPGQLDVSRHGQPTPTARPTATPIGR